MLSLRYSLTVTDYINYHLYIIWDAPENELKRRRYYLKHMGIIVLFTAMFYFTGLFDRSSIFSFIVIVFILLTTLVSMTGIRQAIQKEAQKLSEDPYNSSFFLLKDMIASETGIVMRDEVMETKYNWKAFVKKQENKEYFFLFYNAVQAIVIPKAVFKTVEERFQFDKLLSQFISIDAEIGDMIKS